MPNNAGVAQLVEHFLAKEDVVGSNPITRSKDFVMYVVYWMGLGGDPHAEKFVNLTDALRESKGLRDDGYRFVTMVSEDPNCVSKAGVDSVENGKTPDGHVYDWKMRRKV